ncbi:MAG: hypothetical protein JWO52_7694 [Gammaproteobacteria bacterium]|jgi:hypothetical protein|nr:hypothetical protein [Gammaproteobacteria bacterium]
MAEVIEIVRRSLHDEVAGRLRAMLVEARDSGALRAILIEHLLHKRDTVLELMRAGEVYSK